MQSVNWYADVKRNENLHILPQNDLLYIVMWYFVKKQGADYV